MGNQLENLYSSSRGANGYLIYLARIQREKTWQLRLAPFLLLFGMLLLLPVRAVVSAPVLPPLNSTNTGQQITGKFTWFELASTDIEKHKSFYGDVFGWTFKTISTTDDQYTLILNNGKNIAGLFNVESYSNSKLGGLWIGLMSVTDPATAAKIVEAGGGKIHTPPTTLANRGSYALFIDPEGAIFGVLKSSSGDPVDNKVNTGEFLWMDLFTNDLSAAGIFYQQLASFKVTTSEATKNKIRLIFSSFDKPRAGIVPLSDSANRAGWLPYIKVDNINATLKNVEAAGGYVMVLPGKDILDGNLAIFSDPLGGIMGIIKRQESSNEKKNVTK